MSLDLSSLIQPAVNSAAALAAISRQQEEWGSSIAQANHERIEREKMLVAGAEASVAQKQLLEQQLDTIQKQNELLYDNFLKLKEMYDAQVQANREAKDELEQSRRFNKWMMTVSIIAMLAAIAGPVVTLLVS